MGAATAGNAEVSCIAQSVMNRGRSARPVGIPKPPNSKLRL